MEMALEWLTASMIEFHFFYGTVKNYVMWEVFCVIFLSNRNNPWWIVKITDLPLGSGSDNCLIESPVFVDFFVVDLSECIDRWYHNYTNCWSALHFQVTKNPLDKFCVFSFCWFLNTPTEFISMEMFWWWISTVSDCF